MAALADMAEAERWPINISLLKHVYEAYGPSCFIGAFVADKILIGKNIQ
jgi:hypothetical protein